MDFTVESKSKVSRVLRDFLRKFAGPKKELWSDRALTWRARPIIAVFYGLRPL